MVNNRSPSHFSVKMKHCHNFQIRCYYRSAFNVFLISIYRNAKGNKGLKLSGPSNLPAAKRTQRHTKKTGESMWIVLVLRSDKRHQSIQQLGLVLSDMHNSSAWSVRTNVVKFICLYFGFHTDRGTREQLVSLIKWEISR